MWYSWPDEQSFDAWHTAACTALGIPHPGYNDATGEVDPDAQWTTAYTAAVEVAADDWRAIVEPDVAQLVPDGLGTPCDPPPSPDPEETP
jgi:hypothetical protein